MERFLTTVMTSHGYLALIIFAFVEACCIPISSEITFALAGWLASQGKLSLAGVILFGTLAEMGGSLTSYAIGRRGGHTLLERYGKWVLVSRSDLDRAERLFAGRGSWVVAVARALPLVRCFASFGAGVVEIPAIPFTFFSLIGTAAWATALSLLGYNVGSTLTKFFHSFSVLSVVLAAPPKDDSPTLPSTFPAAGSSTTATPSPNPAPLNGASANSGLPKASRSAPAGR